MNELYASSLTSFLAVAEVAETSETTQNSKRVLLRETQSELYASSATMGIRLRWEFGYESITSGYRRSVFKPMDFTETEFVASPSGDYLKRLPVEYYEGDAIVHWSLTIDHRRSGWLDTLFHARFRELLTHSLSLYRLACPVYCLMPDHIHLMWMGLHPESNQLHAMKHFRKRLNSLLEEVGFRLQIQPYDHVLDTSERGESAFETVCEYIARNPERAGLVPTDGFADYPYTGCLVTGYPELKPFDADFWLRFSRACAYLRERWNASSPGS